MPAKPTAQMTTINNNSRLEKPNNKKSNSSKLMKTRKANLVTAKQQRKT